jgi:hypothetical protein
VTPEELTNHPDHFQDLKEREKQFLLQWISLTIKPYEKVSPLSSYALKHRFEHVGFYVTNGQFKGAMIAAGYAPVDAAILNSSYLIAPVVPYKKTSPANDQFKLPEASVEDFTREMAAYKKTDEYRSG